MYFDFEVSIHAPVKGRPFVPGFATIIGRFNPRPREGATVDHRSF